MADTDPRTGPTGEPITRAERLAADWCRAWGDDHGMWLRKWLERCVEAELASRRAACGDAVDGLAFDDAG